MNSEHSSPDAPGYRPLSIDPVDHFIQWLGDAGHPFFKEPQSTELLLLNIKKTIKTSLDLDQARLQSIDYLKRLAIRRDHYQSFDTAIEIMMRSHRIWQLNDQSLDFFQDLFRKNPSVFDVLIKAISNLCDTNMLFLQAGHIDAVVTSLFKQIELPEASFAVIDDFLDRKSLDIERIIQSLRIQHQPELAITANKHLLIHHDIPHALEIRTRAMHVICHHLHLVATDSKRDRFLQNLISLMIEFHDYVQVDKGDFKSVEHATAMSVIEWLTTALALAEEPELKKIIECVAQHVIILGTTMVFSRTQTTDLSQLFLMVEDAAISAGLFVAHESNRELIHLMKAAMLVTGVCDKNPSAVTAVARMQYDDEKTKTLAVIKRYVQAPLLLERFFTSDLFTPQSDAKVPSAALDQQRFLITLVPHLCMSAELNKGASLVAVTAYIDFIISCRQALLMGHTDLAFKRWYDKTFIEKNMAAVVDVIFFVGIDSEIAFSRSQLGGLQFIADKLHTLFSPLLFAKDGPLIDLTVPLQDVANFSAFKLFYDGLDQVDKNSLINEMLLVVVLQAGQVYAQQAFLAQGSFKCVKAPVVSSLGAQRFFLSVAPDLSPPSPVGQTQISHC